MEWIEAKLGDVCKIERGGSPRPINKFITEAEDGINWIKIGDTSKESIYINKTKEKIKPSGVVKSRRVCSGDLLLSNSMSFGRPYILRVDGCIHDGWLVIHDNENRFNKVFLCYLLGSPLVYSKFKNMAVGGVVNNLNSKMVRNLKIKYPPIKIQKKIVEVLDKAQVLIDLKKKQIELLDELIQSVFYDMFGDPVTNPKGWEKGRLEKYCDVYRGGSPRPIKDYFGGNIPWIKIGDATKGDDVYLFSTKEHIVESGVKKSRLVKNGSLIFANCGVSLGFARIIRFDGCIHDGWLSFENIDDKLDKVFLLKLLNCYTEFFRRTAPDGTQPNLNTKIMKDFEIIIPPINIQLNYRIKLEKMIEQKQLMQQSLTEMENYFNSLMQSAFKGELFN